MAGTGSGLLQPTKLIQTDDFMDSMALPGYIQTGSTTLAADLAYSATNTILYTVPDGMTVKVMDAGVTCTSAEGLDGSHRIKLSISSVTHVVGASPPHIQEDYLFSPTFLLTADGVLGATRSLGRGSFDLHAEATAVSSQWGPGTTFAYNLTAQEGTTTTLGGTVWIRLKFISKDTDAI